MKDLAPVLVLATALGCAVSAGCSYQLVSPPARMVNLDTARAAAPGETVAGVKGAAYAAVFDPGAAVATAGVHRGVAAGIELNAEATYARVTGASSNPDINRDIYVGRAGFKAANAGGWAAVLGGAGGGYSPAAGNFVAADVGGVLSVPNCYLVPFLGGALFASTPVAARRVDFKDDTGRVVAYDTANTTVGFGAGTGLEIPLDRDRCRQGLTPARLQVGASFNVLRPVNGETRLTVSDDGGTPTTTTSGSVTYGAFGLAAGVEIPF
jgi:hypothetical protein